MEICDYDATCKHEAMALNTRYLCRIRKAVMITLSNKMDSHKSLPPKHFIPPGSRVASPSCSILLQRHQVERDHTPLSPVCTLQRLELLSQCLQGTDFSCLSWSRNNKRTIIWPSWTLARVRFQAMLTSSRYDAKSAIEYIRVTRCSRVVWSHKSAGLGSHQARRKCSGEADILYRHSGSGNTFARRCAISRITVMHIHQSLGAADSSSSHEACVQTSAKYQSVNPAYAKSNIDSAPLASPLACSQT